MFKDKPSLQGRREKQYSDSMRIIGYCYLTLTIIAVISLALSLFN
jgi:hypothetical protein